MYKGPPTRYSNLISNSNKGKDNGTDSTVSMTEQIFKDCRSLQDPFYTDLKGSHKYKVTEDLNLEVTGGTLVASDDDGNVAFIISEHDFSNFIEVYTKDRIEQAFAEYGLKRNDDK